jgi:hypothetical protein
MTTANTTETVIELVTDWRAVWLALLIGGAIGAGVLLLYLSQSGDTEGDA